jgi:hypothetical protein
MGEFDMKLTKERLKQIIKEELGRLAVNEEEMEQSSAQRNIAMRDAIDGILQQLAQIHGGDEGRAKGELINYLKTGDRSSLQGGM